MINAWIVQLFIFGTIRPPATDGTLSAHLYVNVFIRLQASPRTLYLCQWTANSVSRNICSKFQCRVMNPSATMEDKCCGWKNVWQLPTERLTMMPTLDSYPSTMIIIDCQPLPYRSVCHIIVWTYLLCEIARLNCDKCGQIALKWEYRGMDAASYSQETSQAPFLIKWLISGHCIYVRADLSNSHFPNAVSIQARTLGPVKLHRGKKLYERLVTGAVDSWVFSSTAPTKL